MFYNYDNEQLSESDSVIFPDGPALLLEFKDTLELPFRGWYYFPTIEQARAFWNIPDPLAQEEIVQP